jgi:molybdopterin adenylyltransferase
MQFHTKEAQIERRIERFIAIFGALIAATAVCERMIPGFPEQMSAAGAKKTARSILSRAAAGIRGTTIIINLPGSPKCAVESLDTVAELLPHAVAVLHGARHTC